MGASPSHSAPPPPLLVAKRSLGLCLRGSGGCRGAAVLPGVGGFFQRKDRPTAPVTAKPPLVTTPQPPSVTLQPPSVTPRTVEVGLTNASGVFLFSPRTALGGGAGVGGGGGGGAHVTDYTSPYGGGGDLAQGRAEADTAGPTGGGVPWRKRSDARTCARTHTALPEDGPSARTFLHGTSFLKATHSCFPPRCQGMETPGTRPSQKNGFLWLFSKDVETWVRQLRRPFSAATVLLYMTPIAIHYG